MNRGLVGLVGLVGLIDTTMNEFMMTILVASTNVLDKAVPFKPT
jgi:hypothetical protein